ncbi:uncharacterized protein LOC134839278 [Symsagittifera roscoffensis]|uniref:uncharacterized protein LOC134839278 n=1 Tax=Symsagittifera roscoffensis TaxID=84072 RepID=UPI00307CBFB0
MKNEDDAANEQYLLDSILHEKSELPLLALINRFGGRDDETEKFCASLDDVKKELEQKLHFILDSRASQSLEAFLHINAVQEQIADLRENEQYFQQSVADTQESLAQSLAQYKKVTTARNNLHRCMGEVKICLDMAEALQKIESLTEEKDFYTAALTIDRLKSKIASADSSYQFIPRMAHALELQSARVFDDSLETLGSFLKVMSENFVRVGKDAVENRWACDPDQFVDFSKLANCFFIAQLFKNEADFIFHFQQQTVSLLEHICSIRKHNTLQGFPDFIFSLIGYFVSLIRTTQILPELAENVPNLANQAALQVHEKVEKILDKAENDFMSEPKSESLLLAVCELINLFQYYGIQNSALDACLNKLFGDFCRDYVNIQVEKIIEGRNKNRTEISDQTEPSVKVNLREVFDKLEKPRFSSNSLNSGSLEKVWNDHRERFFDLFMENYLRNALDVVIPREDENNIRKLITMLSKYKNSGNEKELTIFESLALKKIENMIRLPVQRIAASLSFEEGANMQVNEMLQSNDGNLLAKLNHWIMEQIEQLKQYPKGLQVAIDFYATEMNSLMRTLTKNPTMNFAALVTFLDTCDQIMKIGSEHKNQTEQIREIATLRKFIDLILNAEDASQTLEIYGKLFPENQNKSKLKLLGMLKTIRNNTQMDKLYTKTARGKQQLKTSANLVKKLEKLK